jgi:5'(3')-deoxyribonucleotidase
MLLRKVFCNTFTYHYLGGWDKIYHHGQLINHNKNEILIFKAQEVYDEVHKKNDRRLSRIRSDYNKSYGQWHSSFAHAHKLQV